ncbi:MAG: GCN5-related N-acetyltransferase [Pseudomonadota bacterium]
MSEQSKGVSNASAFLFPALEDRAALEAVWLDLTNRALPRLAAKRDKPISEIHCFQRALLDRACGRGRNKHLAGPPAYRRVSDSMLVGVVAAVRDVLSGQADLGSLNQPSLVRREKR